MRTCRKGGNGFPVDFDELAQRSPGPRKWLGFLRLDVDRAGKQFDELQGDPLRTWALSRLLNTFFAGRANELLESKYRNIYAVYGGGDDLFVIGPWTDLLDFALELRTELRSLTKGQLSFSAGLSLAKPHEHILTQARLSGGELEQAKDKPGYDHEKPGHVRETGRDQIRALGATVDWHNFKNLLPAAKQVEAWLQAAGNELPSSFLHQALRFHQEWSRARAGLHSPNDPRLHRYRPLLYYQIERNLRAGPAKDWARGLLREHSHWPWADFLIRYALLASCTEKEKAKP